MPMENDFFPKLNFWEDAKTDWSALDGHQKKFVAKALQKIEENADGIGEVLSKKRHIDLTGYRKVKLKAVGIRIVYKVLNDKIEVAEIVAIGNRADEEVYKEAFERIAKNRNKIAKS